jgi:hypothetical protein
VKDGKRKFPRFDVLSDQISPIKLAFLAYRITRPQGCVIAVEERSHKLLVSIYGRCNGALYFAHSQMSVWKHLAVDWDINGLC